MINDSKLKRAWMEFSIEKRFLIFGVAVALLLIIAGAATVLIIQN